MPATEPRNRRCTTSLLVLFALCSLVACSDDPHVTVGDQRPATIAGPSSNGRSGGALDGDDPAAGSATRTPARPSAGSRADEPARAPITPVRIDRTGADNPAGLTPAEVEALKSGGPSDGMRLLYPYEGTVFPRGTITPLVMWELAGVADAVYLRIQSQAFEYDGVHKPALDRALHIPNLAPAAAITPALLGPVLAFQGPTQLAIPQDIWDTAGRQTLGKNDPFTIELTVRAGGTIHGPIRSRITIAEATVKGSLFYSACVASLPAGEMPATTGLSAGAVTAVGFNSRVFRIPPGGTAEHILESNKCIGCHSVASGGARMTAQRAPTIDDQLTQGLMGVSPMSRGVSYELGPDGRPTASTGTDIGQTAAYGALYPDGSKFLSSAVPPVSLATLAAGFSNIGYIATFGGVTAPPALLPATLRDAVTGEVVEGTAIPPTALMPTFSPDGTRLVFNDYALDDAHGLAVMDYDVRSHRASGYRELAREASNSELRPGWPFFLPDNRAVVFVRTTSPTFGGTSGVGGSASANLAQTGATTDQVERKPSDLYIADVHSGTVTLLARAMGFATPADFPSGNSYLPFGEADLHTSYFPTVSPVAAGGYFWVFFDSLRNFGSLGTHRLLWGFAVDISPDGSYLADPSHPPFYVSGQEFVGNNNHRAFAALDRCRAEGEDCASGVDCCSGFCSQRCVPPPDEGCAQLDERCAGASDCCNPDHACINGFCATVPLL